MQDGSSPMPVITLAGDQADSVTWMVDALVHFLLIDFAIRVLLITFVLIRKSKQPQTALTWVILLMGLPILGFVLYGLFGEERFGYFRKKRHAAAVKRVDMPGVHANSVAENRVALQMTSSQIASLAEQVSGSAPVSGNQITLLGDSERFVTMLSADIRAAEEEVHLLFFIYLDDAAGQMVADAMIEAAKKGVVCRLLVDAVGSKRFLRSKLVHTMREHGIEVVGALPVNPIRMLFSRLDLRNHRKIAVIDGQIGYTGSNNLAEAAFAIKPDFAPWVDCSIRIDGPATKELQILFIEDWHFETGKLPEVPLNRQPKNREQGLPVQIIATGPNFYNEATTQIVQACIHQASHELVLTTPYFVPDETTIKNLCVCARRGVQTTLVVPARNDSWMVAAASRSNYEPLLNAGVDIHEFNGGLLHAKTITIDREIGVVMSANLDRRSFNLNFECGGIIYDSDFAVQLRDLQQSYIERSGRIEEHEWLKRGLARRVGNTLAGFLSPIL
ncbi:MAG: cardiolipin synthase [Phycisphaerae bacterium]|nr:cardiolipin synthase [Phycisphaerae bacterium]